MQGKWDESNASEISLSVYADYPISLLTEDKAPFDNWRNPGSEIEPGLEEMFQGCVLMYQMYIYYILTERRFGRMTADRVLDLQVERFDRVSGKLAKRFCATLKNIRSLVSRTLEAPDTVPGESDSFEIPVEYNLALQFLVGFEGSPFYLTDAEYEEAMIPDFRGQDLALEECLEHGAQAALDEFLAFTQQAKVRLY